MAKKKTKVPSVAEMISHLQNGGVSFRKTPKGSHIAKVPMYNTLWVIIIPKSVVKKKVLTLDATVYNGETLFLAVDAKGLVDRADTTWVSP